MFSQGLNLLKKVMSISILALGIGLNAECIDDGFGGGMDSVTYEYCVPLGNEIVSDTYPTTEDKNISADISADYVFSMDDFYYSDTDGDPLSIVMVTGLYDDQYQSANASLYDDANDNGVIDSGENINIGYPLNNVLSAIQSSRLKFKPTKSGEHYLYFLVGNTNNYSNGGSESNIVTINVTGVLNNAPTDISITNNSISENNQSGTVIANILSIDRDSGDTHTFNFCGGSDDNKFVIDGSLLKSNSLFDFETKSSYSICLKVSDKANAEFSKIFTITITDANDAPIVTSSNRSKALPNVTFNHFLSATDENGDVITWSIKDDETLPSWLKFDNFIKPDFTITNTYNITDYLVDISSNYTEGDILSFDTTKLPDGVTGDFNATKGLLKFTGTATPLQWQELLRTVSAKFSSKNLEQRTINFTEGSTVGMLINGKMHYYEVVNEPKTWSEAKTLAEAKTFNRLQGYLVTITSQEENDFVVQKVNSDSWMGASDSENETVWKWVTGPEAETQFFNQSQYGGGVSVNGMYSNWSANEPNQFNGINEDYGHIYASNKQWNDFPNQYTISYIVEYGGMSEDANASITQSVSMSSSSYRLYGTPSTAGTYVIQLTLTDGINYVDHTLTISDSDQNQSQSVNLDIKQGWNLISLPLETEINSDEFDAIFGSDVVIWQYNSGSTNQPWSIYLGSGIASSITIPDTIGQISVISEKEGFWVNSTSNKVVSFSSN